MLQTLKIENVALIDCLELHFDKKLNVISGETGSGKSIMLDSLSFVFGGRADRSLIRENEKSMKVEAIFSNLKQNQLNYIKELCGLEADSELFISRELDINGKNTCKINGELVPVATVKKICSILVDIHGQSEHLSILDNAYQLEAIDLYGKIPEQLFIDLSKTIDEYKENEKEIKLLGGSEIEKQNLIDLYSYQVQEIENAKIGENEYEALTDEKKQMSAHEKINENLKSSYEAAMKSSYDRSASEQLDIMKKCLQNIEIYDTGYASLLERVKSCMIELNDIADTIHEKLNSNIFDEARFEWVDNRLDFIKTMFRKYFAPEPTSELDYLDGLCAGDFRNVYDQTKFEDEVSPEYITDLLSNELKFKKEKQSEKSIGFCW